MNNIGVGDTQLIVLPTTPLWQCISTPSGCKCIPPRVRDPKNPNKWITPPGYTCDKGYGLCFGGWPQCGQRCTGSEVCKIYGRKPPCPGPEPDCNITEELVCDKGEWKCVETPNVQLVCDPMGNWPYHKCIKPGAPGWACDKDRSMCSTSVDACEQKGFAVCKAPPPPCPGSQPYCPGGKVICDKTERKWKCISPKGYKCNRSELGIYSCDPQYTECIPGTKCYATYNQCQLICGPGPEQRGFMCTMSPMGGYGCQPKNCTPGNGNVNWQERCYDTMLNCSTHCGPGGQAYAQCVSDPTGDFPCKCIDNTNPDFTCDKGYGMCFSTYAQCGQNCQGDICLIEGCPAGQEIPCKKDEELICGNKGKWICVKTKKAGV
jgi:hypothetical protein